ncbi:MAG: hypothetical protein WC485_11470 [Opitutaceae bacterium]
MTFDEYEATMRNLLVVDGPTNAAWVQILPQMISYAEHRIQADLDLIATNTSETVPLTTGRRTVAIPTCIYIVNSVNLITPSATQPDQGERVPLQRLSVEAMNFMWPSATDTGAPQNYAILNDTTCILGPVPDAAYKAEFYGIFQLTPISAERPSNWISVNMPDVLIAASMVFGAGWQRDFGSQAEDPKLGLSWEAQYQSLLKSETVQAYRQYARSSAWQPMSPSPLAPRT